MSESIFKHGEFFIGCNYWASHAGTNMWRDWDEKEVEADFKRYTDNGLRLLRIFPLWPDFQPMDLDEAIAQYHSRNRRFGGV